MAAVNKDEVFECMKKGMCSRGPKAKMLGLDYMNTEGLLYWQLHEQNVFSPGEYGCTFSHLRAIHQVQPPARVASPAHRTNPNPNP